MWLLACSSATLEREPPFSGEIADAPHPTALNAWTFQVELSEPEPLEVSCTLASDPEERHELAFPSKASHEVSLFGLLAGERYDCTFTARNWSEQRSIQTPPLPDWIPGWTLQALAGGGAGYTLFNHGTDDEEARDPKLIIVDAEARLRWAWRPPFLKATDLDAQYLGDGQILYGGGYGVPPTVIDLAGEVLTQAGEPSTGGVYHHHAERLPDGQVITLVTADNTDGEVTWSGFAIDRLDGTLTQRISSWNSQRGVDEGWLPPGEEGEDLYHANALLPNGDELWINLFRLAQVVALDAQGAHRFTLGRGQDFTLLDETGAPAPDSEWFSRSHAPEKHGNRLFLYENGDDDRPWSMVSEFELDEEARTIRRVWSFTEPGWYTPIWGDIDWLPDDRVLIVRAHCETCLPDLEQHTQILEVDRATDTVVWRMTFDDPHSASYRAERIDPCAIFANRKYCPE